MPVYNKYDYLKESIQSAINQDFGEPYEIVIVDNNPEPNNPCLDIVKELKSTKILYYQNEKNIGMVKNGNQSVLLSRSELFTFLHDDDLLCSDALSELYSFSKDHKGVLLAKQSIIDSNDRVLDKPQKFKFRRKISRLFKYSLILDSVSTGVGSLYHKSEFISLEGYNEDIYPSHDYKINADYVTRYGGYAISNPLSKVRVAENASFQVYDMYTDICFRIRQSIIQSYNSSFKRGLYGIVSSYKREYDDVNNKVHWGGEKRENIKYNRWKYGIIKYLIKIERVRRILY